MAISDPNHVFRIEEYNEYNVQISDNEYQCDIRGICEMPNEDLVIADFGNCKVKLLDKEYRVVDYRVIPGQPCDVCHIGGNEVVVCVNSEIYFIYVVKSQLVNSRELSFSHGCYAAAHHNGQLYVSSGNALYVYTMSGQKVKKLYEDKSGSDTVKKCAISNDGKKIFITNFNHHQLITLDNSGNKLALLTDTDMKAPSGIYVTSAGHVIVCCSVADTVLQVDKDGKRKLATLAREEDDIFGPKVFILQQLHLLSDCWQYERNTACGQVDIIL